MFNKITKDEAYYSTADNGWYDRGVPIRLKLAESAMIGLLSGNVSCDNVINEAFKIADAMIKKYNDDLEKE